MPISLHVTANDRKIQDIVKDRYPGMQFLVDELQDDTSKVDKIMDRNYNYSNLIIDVIDHYSRLQKLDEGLSEILCNMPKKVRPLKEDKEKELEVIFPTGNYDFKNEPLQKKISLSPNMRTQQTKFFQTLQPNDPNSNFQDSPKVKSIPRPLKKAVDMVIKMNSEKRNREKKAIRRDSLQQFKQIAALQKADQNNIKPSLVTRGNHLKLNLPIPVAPKKVKANLPLSPTRTKKQLVEVPNNNNEIINQTFGKIQVQETSDSIVEQENQKYRDEQLKDLQQNVLNDDYPTQTNGQGQGHSQNDTHRKRPGDQTEKKKSRKHKDLEETKEMAQELTKPGLRSKRESSKSLVNLTPPGTNPSAQNNKSRNHFVLPSSKTENIVKQNTQVNSATTLDVQNRSSRPKLKPRSKLSGKYAIENDKQEKRIMAAKRKESFNKIARDNQMLHFKLQIGIQNSNIASQSTNSPGLPDVTNNNKKI